MEKAEEQMVNNKFQKLLPSPIKKKKRIQDGEKIQQKAHKEWKSFSHLSKGGKKNKKWKKGVEVTLI